MSPRPAPLMKRLATLAGAALAVLASCAEPSAPQEEPLAQTAQAVALPADGDPSWTKVFEDGFNLPHVVSTDTDGMSVYTVQWKPRLEEPGLQTNRHRHLGAEADGRVPQRWTPPPESSR